MLSATIRVAERIRSRSPVMRAFFEREAARVAAAAAATAERFERGGRLFAIGYGAYKTDAAHLSVEFIHPVIVGKPALPALDLSASPGDVPLVALDDDVVVTFSPQAVEIAPRGQEPYLFCAPCGDPHIDQETFEVLGHTFYESVQVFLEHRSVGPDAGAASFLYPYLGEGRRDMGALQAEVAESILAKVADAERLRDAVAERQSGAIERAASAIAERLSRGGRILAFGNGGSATDADDFVLDCRTPDDGLKSVPAISLSSEPAVLSAIGNDVGFELVFLRQICAQAREGDVAFALSTSGGSKNVVAALREARKRGVLTVALVGYDGGEIVRSGIAEHAIVVECDYVPRIQEAQAAIYHVLREYLGR